MEYYFFFLRKMIFFQTPSEDVLNMAKILARLEKLENHTRELEEELNNERRIRESLEVSSEIIFNL